MLQSIQIDPRPREISQPDRAEADLDLRQVFASIWRRKWTVILFALAAAALAGLFAKIATPRFSATAVVMLDTRENNVVDLNSVVSGLSADTAVVNTEVEVMKSRRILGRVVDTLNLTADPEFNWRLAPESRWKRLIGYRQLREDLGIPVAEYPPDPPEMVRQEAIDMLDALTSVSSVRQSYVFEIDVDTKSAEKSALIANTIAETYIRAQLEIKFEATEQATAWLGERVSELKQKLVDAEAAVEAYNSDISLVSEEALIQSGRQVKDLRQRLEDLTQQQTGLKAQIADERRLRAAGAFGQIAALADSPELRRLAGEIESASEESRAAAVARFDAALDQQLSRMSQQLTKAASSAAVLADSITELEGRVDADSRDLIELRQLQREAEANRLIYEFFLTRMKETSVQQGIQQADSRVLSAATPPFDPYYPRTTLMIALAIVAGGFAGVVYVVLRDRYRSTFASTEELEAAVGLPVLGALPEAPTRRRRALLDYVVEKPSSSLAEAVRNLRTSILLANIDAPPKVIMSTSSVPGEGKTTLSLLLAHNSVALGKKVLIVECDLRRRTFKTYFHLDDPSGLLTILSGARSAEEVIQHDEASGLDVVVGEESSTNAADVFSSQRFAEFVAEMRERYDFVIIDTPPVLAVPDARVIAKQCDAVLYSVRWDKTPRQLVRQGLMLFSQIKVRVTGLALTQVNQRKMARYGYGGYGDYYKTTKSYHAN